MTLRSSKYIRLLKRGRGGRPRPPATRKGRKSLCRWGSRRTSVRLRYIVLTAHLASVWRDALVPPPNLAERSLLMNEQFRVSGRYLASLVKRARRGGAKHRKNSPQATVFSQSGEATVLRAGGSCEFER